MKSENFHALTSELTQLTPHQRSILSDRLREIEHASVSRTLIEERLSNKPLCPKCSKKHIVRWGSASRLQRYRCQDCKVIFNALTGTSLARLRHKDKWLCYSQQLSEGRSIRCRVGACGVHNTTSFRWRHRFLVEPGTHKPEQLKGIVEADETFFRESFKSKQHGMTRPTSVAHRHRREVCPQSRSPYWSVVTDVAVRLTMYLKKMMPDTSVLH